MARPYLSIIIPAYNEAERIPQTLLDIDKRLEHAPYSYEILVIDDGSKDNTVQVVENLARAVKNLKVIPSGVNQGKGGAVRQGMLMANGVIRLFMDADNSTAIGQFDQMMPLFKAGYDVVIGSRVAKGAKMDPPEPWYRQIPGKLGNLLIQILLLPGFWDTQCGFKAFTEDAARKVFEISKIDRWAFDVEVLSLARRFGYRIKEVPVYWKADARTHIRASAYLKFLWETFTIRWWLWKGKYGPLVGPVPGVPKNNGQNVT